MQKKLFIIGFLVVFLVVANNAMLFAKENLIVSMFGGTFEKAEREIMVEDFEKENDCTVLVETLLSLAALNKVRAEKDNPTLAVPQMDEIFAIQAVQQDIYTTLDLSKLKNFKDIDGIFTYDHNKFVGWYWGNLLIAYNSDYVKDPPKSWEDLWDPKYKGKLILPDITQTTGMYVLVALSMLNGGSETNVDPGFEKLASIKPNVLTFWTSHDQVARMLNSGEAWITVWVADRAYTQEMMGSPIRSVVPEGAPYYVGVVGIPDKIEDKELAYKWIDKLLSPEVQKFLGEKITLSPTNTKVDLDLDPAVVERMIGESTKNKLIKNMDYIKINELREGWIERFRREISSQ